MDNHQQHNTNNQQDGKVPFQLDKNQLDYDFLILGSNIEEAIISGILSKKGRKCLIIDSDGNYNLSQATMSFKEYVNPDDVSYGPQKQSGFQTLKIEKQTGLEVKFNREYNIDINPRLLYSESLPVSVMCDAEMDKYMDFQAIQNIYYYYEDNNKHGRLLETPCTKGEIFSHKQFSLLEKRQIFKQMQDFINVFGKIHNIESDVNSTLEFDKQTETNQKEYQLYEEIKEQDCQQYFRKKGMKDNISELFIFGIANYEYSEQFIKEQDDEYIQQYLKEKFKYKNMMERVYKYVKSLQVHSSKPYLYTNYGTGDIPQGFSRIAAVYGSIFTMHKNIRIQSINKIEQKDDEQQQHRYQVYSNLSEFAINVNKIVCGYNYRGLIESLGCIQKQKSYLLSCLRANILLECDQSQWNGKCPVLFKLKPMIQNINNINPVLVIILANNTQTVPKNKLLINIKTVVHNDDGTDNYKQNQLDLMERILAFLQNHFDFGKLVPIDTKQKQNDGQGLQVLVKHVYIQKQCLYQQQQSQNNGALDVISDDNFEIDFDINFREAVQKIEMIFGEKGVGFQNEKQTDGMDQEEQDNIQSILNKMDQLKIENKQID